MTDTRGNREIRWDPVQDGNLDDHQIDATLRWQTPQEVWVGDIFEPAIRGGVIDEIITRMAFSPQHTFRIPTRHPARMREYVAAREIKGWPYPHVLDGQIWDQWPHA